MKNKPKIIRLLEQIKDIIDMIIDMVKKDNS